MIVSPQEYNSALHQLLDPNEFSHLFRIPADEPIYKIDLNTRIIDSPDFLGVRDESNAEIIWFSVDRFYDNLDLYTASCWIQYRNALGKEFYYSAPLIVSSTIYGNETLLIPWAVSQDVVIEPGIVEFSFQFFKLNENGDRFQYILNTQSATSKVLSGFRIDPLNSDESLNDQNSKKFVDEIHALYARIDTLEKDYELNWIIV